MTKRTKMTTTYHTPVMLKEALEGLNVKPNGVYVDTTFGGGGHSYAILNQLDTYGHLYSFDQDLDTIVGAPEDERFTFVRSNFRYLSNWMRYYECESVDGILADLGVSSHHLDEGERGFSFRYDAPLDMRMNQKARLTAKHVVNEYSEQQLADIFYLYGELKDSRRIASVLARHRALTPIETTGQLVDTLAPILGKQREKKDLARVFQALRIEVNGEMQALKQMINAATQLLVPGGRLVVLTYHSLEDRIVKNMIRSGNLQGDTQHDIYGRKIAPLRAIGKMQVPSQQEQMENPRSRSAKLRIGERMKD